MDQDAASRGVRDDNACDVAWRGKQRVGVGTQLLGWFGLRSDDDVFPPDSIAVHVIADREVAKITAFWKYRVEFVDKVQGRQTAGAWPRRNGRGTCHQF